MDSLASQFLASFNRIEKWLRVALAKPTGMGFSEMVRRLSKRDDLLVRKYQEDLLEIAQLRNAIVHDKLAPDFVIAEPNQWVVNKLSQIEADLMQPERVSPRFEKNVTCFDQETELIKVLKIVAAKGFSQFPIYEKQTFLGLVTAHGLGIWMANQTQEETLELKGKKVQAILATDRKRDNYRFISSETLVYTAVEYFLADPTIEALLITKKGEPEGQLMGLIRPSELLQSHYSEWRNKA